MRSFLPAFILFLCCSQYSFAQQGIYIPADGKVCVSGTLPVTFYLNTRNDGALGSYPGTTLYFFGQQWTNGNGSTLPDESNTGRAGSGGVFRFSGNNPLYGAIGRQTLFGGYNAASASGASFPNLTVDNPDGLLLGDLNDTKVRNTLHFQTGNLYLNGWNLVVGDNAPGNITGYSDKRFVVTGSDVAGGSLYRENITGQSGNVVFPIGTSAESYSPVAIRNNGNADMFRARVFDNVYRNAISGSAMLDTFIYKTWNIGRNSNGTGNVALTFQHMNVEESREYIDNRKNSFLNRYINPYWSEQLAQDATIKPGDLSTEAMQQAATMHTQQFLAGMNMNEYYSKATRHEVSGPRIKWLRFEATRLTPIQVGLIWTTWYEMNNDHFEVERRLENENTFRQVGFVASKAINGNSLRMLEYNAFDDNNYYSWSYYRIKAVLRNGDIEYSEIRAVPPLQKVDIFPNPNYGHFKIRISGVKGAMVAKITNTWGQALREYEINGERDIEVTGLPAAMYFITITYKETGAIFHQAKIIVLK